MEEFLIRDDLTLSDREFAVVRRLIHDHAGIAFAEQKRTLVHNRLAPRVRARRLATFADYLEMLPRDGAEFQEFVNALTTNLTSFFREPYHFDVIAEHVRANRSRRSTIWSAACSTGEEPYSIAIRLAEAFPDREPPVRIVATDIDTSMLATASAAVYPLERLANVSRERLKAFFERGVGTKAGFARIAPRLRDLVEFRPLNLVGPKWDVPVPVDLIVCRNVLIYFDQETQSKILRRFATCLERTGRLITGHAENLHHARETFSPCGRSVYRLASAGGQ